MLKDTVIIFGIKVSRSVLVTVSCVFGVVLILVFVTFFLNRHSSQKAQTADRTFRKITDAEVEAYKIQKQQGSNGSHPDSYGKIIISTPGTLARLCPYPNCRADQNIARIPKNTVLEIEGITAAQVGRSPPVTWYEVTYNGKRGWVSIYDTDKQ